MLRAKIKVQATVDGVKVNNKPTFSYAKKAYRKFSSIERRIAYALQEGPRINTFVSDYWILGLLSRREDGRGAQAREDHKGVGSGDC
jgi:hypothetical protein